MPEGRLRILHVEDDDHDRELVAAVLQRDGLACDIVAVDSRERFEAALHEGRFDVILADDRLPTFDGQAALAIAIERAPDVPFIFVSGTLGEEVAIERLKEGATDYVLKQRLSRLPGSIARAIKESLTRADRARAETEIRRLNAELEERVDARTSELARANEALAQRERELLISEQRLQAILDHTPSLIYLKSLDGRFLLVNRQFERTFKLDRSEILGKTVHDLYPRRLAQIYQANDDQALKSGVPVTTEVPVLHDGEVHVYSSTKFAVLDQNGLPFALCGVSSDITERKKADDDIKTARLEAERANRAKSEFLSRMSHDLRTPLNAVLGFAQLLATDALSEEQSEAVQQISKGGQHLLDLINEVLDIARIEAGKLSLSPEPVGVREIVRDSLAFVAPLAAQRSIALVLDETPDAARSVLADRPRLSQILLNLLSNAVKYNRDGGRVTVGFELAASDRLRIKVTDTGAGIPREKLQLVFTPFERLGAETTAIEGTGLGLALSRRLAEAMGGSLGVDSEVDRGSTFWIELGVTHDREVGIVPEPAFRAMTSSSRTATVLYIEDNSANVRLMERVLSRRAGTTLVHAAQGLEGIALAARARPDVIFLDLHLPDVSGEEVLRQLWCDPELRRIPVVVLTADATPGQVRRMTASGASAYLTKPLDLGKLFDTLDRMLSVEPDGGAAPVAVSNL